MLLVRGDNSKGHICNPKISEYRHEPRTLYQSMARAQEDTDDIENLQHFTPTYPVDKALR